MVHNIIRKQSILMSMHSCKTQQQGC